MSAKRKGPPKQRRVRFNHTFVVRYVDDGKGVDLTKLPINSWIVAVQAVFHADPRVEEYESGTHRATLISDAALRRAPGKAKAKKRSTKR